MSSSALEEKGAALCIKSRLVLDLQFVDHFGWSQRLGFASPYIIPRVRRVRAGGKGIIAATIVPPQTRLPRQGAVVMQRTIEAELLR